MSSSSVPAKGIRQQDNGLVQTVEQAAELAAVSAASKERAEIESAMIIAKRMPRNEADAFQRLMKASQRPSFAEDANYTFPRGGQDVTGPSVNLAREAARTWGNIRHGLRVLREDESSRTIMGWAWDLESNTKIEAEDHFEKLIQRRNKQTGKTDWVEPDERDLRELTNRRGAILVRNCILQLLPKDLIEDALYQCGKTLQNAAQSDPDATKKRLLSDFGRINVSVAMLEGVLGHPFDQSSPKELADLRAIHNSIAAGNSTWAEYAKDASQDSESKADINAHLSKQAQESASTGTEAPTSEELKSPPSAAPSGGGPEHMTLQEWNSMLLYLDADQERVKVKNKTKLAMGMKPQDKLTALLANKQVEFIAKLVQIAKQEGVEITF